MSKREYRIECIDCKYDRDFEYACHPHCVHCNRRDNMSDLYELEKLTFEDWWMQNEEFGHTADGFVKDAAAKIWNTAQENK